LLLLQQTEWQQHEQLQQLLRVLLTMQQQQQQLQDLGLVAAAAGVQCGVGGAGWCGVSSRNAS
jgi:hypothetical protein